MSRLGYEGGSGTAASGDYYGVLPAVWCGDQVRGREEPVQKVQPSCLLASDQCFALAFLPAITVCRGRSPLKSKEEGRLNRIRDLDVQFN